MTASAITHQTTIYSKQGEYESKPKDVILRFDGYTRAMQPWLKKGEDKQFWPDVAKGSFYPSTKLLA